MASEASLADVSGGPVSKAALSLQVFFHCDQHGSHHLGEVCWEKQLVRSSLNISWRKAPVGDPMNLLYKKDYYIKLEELVPSIP